MIVFSLQKNNLWNGSGFSVKPGCLELSSLCFAEQSLKIGSGKYRLKIIGNSISGNGIFSVQILLNNKEVFLKTVSLNSKSNTECLFEFELNSVGPYKFKIIRGKESIGRVSVSLINIFKIIEKIPEKNNAQIKSNDDKKTFVVVDYDKLESPTQISSLFLDVNSYKNCFFLLKTESSITPIKDQNFRLFFEWEDLFDYISLFTSKEVIYSESNVSRDIFLKYNCTVSISNPVKYKESKTNKVSGIIF